MSGQSYGTELNQSGRNKMLNAINSKNVMITNTDVLNHCWKHVDHQSPPPFPHSPYSIFSIRIHKHYYLLSPPQPIQFLFHFIFVLFEIFAYSFDITESFFLLLFQIVFILHYFSVTDFILFYIHYVLLLEIKHTM